MLRGNRASLTRSIVGSVAVGFFIVSCVKMLPALTLWASSGFEPASPRFLDTSTLAVYANAREMKRPRNGGLMSAGLRFCPSVYLISASIVHCHVATRFFHVTTETEASLLSDM